MLATEFVNGDTASNATSYEAALPVVHEEDIAEFFVWEHSAFANRFRDVLYERAVRASAEGTDLATLARYYECVYIVDRAISRLDSDMIVAYHQHLLDAPEPLILEIALTALAPLTDGRKVCSAITSQHIAICSEVTSRFGIVAGDVSDECKAVISLAFQYARHSDLILTLLNEGLTDANDIKDKLYAGLI